MRFDRFNCPFALVAFFPCSSQIPSASACIGTIRCFLSSWIEFLWSTLFIIRMMWKPVSRYLHLDPSWPLSWTIHDIHHAARRPPFCCPYVATAISILFDTIICNRYNTDPLNRRAPTDNNICGHPRKRLLTLFLRNIKAAQHWHVVNFMLGIWFILIWMK